VPYISMLQLACLDSFHGLYTVLWMNDTLSGKAKWVWTCKFSDSDTVNSTRPSKEKWLCLIGQP
jgi:hypothetical protein